MLGRRLGWSLQSSALFSCGADRNAKGMNFKTRNQLALLGKEIFFLSLRLWSRHFYIHYPYKKLDITVPIL
jgi:hypothetical protein